MWNCEQCSESVDDEFVVCWSCGTGRDGTLDPEFKLETSGGQPHSTDPITDDVQDVETFKKRVIDRFECVKCRHTESVVRRMVNLDTGYGQLFPFCRPNRFLVVTCKRCGYSEFYDSRIADPRLNSFLRRFLPW